MAQTTNSLKPSLIANANANANAMTCYRCARPNSCATTRCIAGYEWVVLWVGAKCAGRSR